MNVLTVRRHRMALSSMIIEIMRNENKSLLEAYAKLASMATSDEVIALAKTEINRLNGVK